MCIGMVGTITILLIVAAAILGAFYLGVKVTQDTQKVNFDLTFTRITFIASITCDCGK